MTINELTKEIHDNAKNHGWWDEPRSFAEVMALCVSELAEALEEDRAGKPMVYCKEHDEDVCGDCLECREGCAFNGDKPEGVATEMADCIIRILDWAGYAGVDMEQVILMKHEFNKGRPYKHGKKY